MPVIIILLMLLFSTPISAAEIPLPNNTAIPDLGGDYYCVGHPTVCYQGGLYGHGANTMPSDHAAQGAELASRIVPIDGKIGMISIGMSNAALEFSRFVSADVSHNPAVNPQLTVINAASGADPGPCDFTVAHGPVQPVCSDTFKENAYDYLRDTFLTPGGLAEDQVQVVWYKMALPFSAQLAAPPTLPNPKANAFVYEGYIGGTMRALKQRYPNIKMVFITSRIYGGYNQASKSPEPYAYECGFSTQFAIQAQINQADQGGKPDPIAGDLGYNVAPWMAWGPYIWSNGGTPNTYNGVYWCGGSLSPEPPCNGVLDDFQSDLLHPALSGQMKVSNQFWNFFSTSEFTKSWFLAP